MDEFFAARDEAARRLAQPDQWWTADGHSVIVPAAFVRWALALTASIVPVRAATPDADPTADRAPGELMEEWGK